jgi:hypothetical protein
MNLATTTSRTIRLGQNRDNIVSRAQQGLQ